MDVTEIGPSGRTKRSYTKRGAPVRPDPIRAAPEVREEVRPKVRVRKQSGTNPMDLPKELMDRFRSEGIDLLWGPNTVNGMPDPARYQQYEINSWEPVHPNMFGGVLDGIFTPKGFKGEITFGASVLMWRPLELSIESRAEETQSARSAVRVHEAKLRGGHIDNVTLDTFHPSARANTKLDREVLRMPIPKD